MPRPRKTEERISLDEAAERLGVHYMTAYRYVRLGRLPAAKVGGQWQVPVSGVEALLKGAEDGESAARRGRPRVAVHRERLLDRLLANDEQGAWTVVENARVAGLAPVDVHLELLGPALRTIGERWEAGELGVGDEHRATAVAIRVVGRLGPEFVRRGRRRGTVIVGAAPGDPHALPAAMLADVLRGAQYSVLDLGGATPVESFVDAVRATDDLVAVCVSFSVSDRDDVIEAVVGAVREVTDAPVFVGGPACNGERHAAALGADGTAADAGAAVELIDAARLGR